MHYGFIRSYLDLNQTDRLIQILKLKVRLIATLFHFIIWSLFLFSFDWFHLKKYKFGIFVDSFTANMIMDYYLRKSNFKLATLCAHEVMLQELSENQLTLGHSLQSCLKYIWSIKSSKDATQLEEFDKEQSPQQQADPNDKPVIFRSISYL